MSCSLPEQCSNLLEELQYVELPQDRARTLLEEYRDEARRLLPPIPKQEKKKSRPHKKRSHPLGPRPSHRIQWTGRHGQCEKRWPRLLGDLIFMMLAKVFMVLVGWNDTRSNMQQPRYVSVSSRIKHLAAPQTAEIFELSQQHPLYLF